MKDYSESEVRAALSRLVDLARKHKVAIVGIRHLTKRPDDEVTLRVLGAAAWVAVPRSIVLVGVDRNGEQRSSDDPAGSLTTCAVVSLKANHNGTPMPLRFTIGDDGLHWMGRDPSIAQDDLLPRQAQHHTALVFHAGDGPLRLRRQ